MKKRMMVLGLVLIILVGCQAKPDEVALQLAEAVNAQDLDGALALFAEDAVVDTGGPAPFTGKAEIQGWLEGMFEDSFKIEVEIMEVSGDKVIEKDTMKMNSMRLLGIASLDGISEITVQGGKITAINFSFTEESLAKLPIPVSTAQDLVGIWHQTPTNPFLGEFYFQYRDDGTYRNATGTPDRLESNPLVEGEYWFEDGLLFDKGTAAVASWNECIEPAQIIGQYEVLMFSTGNIRLVKFEDECDGRVQVLPGEYEPVSE